MKQQHKIYHYTKHGSQSNDKTAQNLPLYQSIVLNSMIQQHKIYNYTEHNSKSDDSTVIPSIVINPMIQQHQIYHYTEHVSQYHDITAEDLPLYRTCFSIS